MDSQTSLPIRPPLHAVSHDDVYPGLPLPTPDHIRLLLLQPGSDDETVCCELVTAEIHSAKAYEALSYTWGGVSDYQIIHVTTIESIEPKEISVTSNCFSALKRLRHKEQLRTLWIDALCIDQSNLSERNHQVNLMSKIYSQAADVVIYLGEAAENSDLAVDFIVDCDDLTTSSSLSFPKSEPLIQALNDFFHRPWFTRVWVIQEATLSSSGIVYCGQKSLAWSAIKNFNVWNTSKKWLHQLPFVVSISKKFLTKGDLGDLMFRSLLESRHCGATNARDKVYALLPLLHSFEKQIALTPMYANSIAKVYTDCAMTLIEECGFDVLYGVQGGSKIHNLPSWVPDWSIPPKRRVFGKYGSATKSRFWGLTKKVDVPEKPQIIISASTNIDNENTLSMLRVSGYLCGEITKIGSTYLAGQGVFPLYDWEDLYLNDESAMAIERKIDVPIETNAWDYTFCLVIGAAGFAIPDAITYFVDDEEEYEEDFMSVSDSSKSESGEVVSRDKNSAVQKPSSTEGEPKKGDVGKNPTSADVKSEVSWESVVREFISKRNESGDNAISFRDIPFHQAGKTITSPSWRVYVQRLLRNCHSRRFFVTDKGYMGLAPEEAEVGDQIYICVGATVPFAFRVVRKKSHEQEPEPERFHLVGECSLEDNAWDDVRDSSELPRYIEII